MSLTAAVFKNKDQDVKSINALYQFFLKIWQDTWQELNVNSTSFQDDFYRFDEKLGLFSHNQPIAFHGYGNYNLHIQADCSHSYFRKIDLPIADQLKKLNFYNIATLEYMAVHPKFRKIANQNLGEILGGLSTQRFSQKPVDAVLTISRNDRGVNKMCRMYGAWPLYENFKLYNVFVDIMVFEPKNIKKNSNPEVQQIIDGLLDQITTDQNMRISA